MIQTLGGPVCASFVSRWSSGDFRLTRSHGLPHARRPAGTLRNQAGSERAPGNPRSGRVGVPTGPPGEQVLPAWPAAGMSEEPEHG